MANGYFRRRQQTLLLLCTQGGLGGTQLVVILLASQFAARGWRVRTIFPYVPEGGDIAANEELLELAHSYGVEAETHTAMLNRSQPHSIKTMLALTSLIRETAPDVVNMHYGWNAISAYDMLSLRLSRVRRSIVSLHLPVEWAEQGGEHRRRMTTWAAKLTDAIVPCSDAVRDSVVEAGIQASKLHVIPGGIQPPASLPEQSEVRTRLGIPENAFTACTVARMVPDKGLPDLINALAPLVKEDPEWFLLLKGYGPDRPELEALAAERLGTRFRIVGNEIPSDDIYAAGDVFVLPSYKEGWPLVVMEAAFCGLPAVVTNIGSVPQQVTDGLTGRIVAVGEPAQLGAVLRELRSQPEHTLRLGQAARQRAHSEFTAQAMADRYEKLYTRHRLQGSAAPFAAS